MAVTTNMPNSINSPTLVLSCMRLIRMHMLIQLVLESSGLMLLLISYSVQGKLYKICCTLMSMVRYLHMFSTAQGNNRDQSHPLMSVMLCMFLLLFFLCSWNLAANKKGDFQFCRYGDDVQISAKILFRKGFVQKKKVFTPQFICLLLA